MRRELRQLSLADGLVEGSAARNRQLERIAALVDWAAFARLLGEVYAAPVGRASYRPVVLIRALLLRQWYRLPDPAPNPLYLTASIPPRPRSPLPGRPPRRCRGAPAQIPTISWTC